MTFNDPFASPSPDREPPQTETFPTAAPQGGYAAPGPAVLASPGPVAPHALQPAYGSAHTGQRPQSTDGVSIAALVTGLVGLGPVAVVLGAIGLRRTASGQRKGTGMAVAGLALGLVGTIAATAVITWFAAAASQVFNSDVWGTGFGETGMYYEGESYGDNEYLDELWDKCEDGDGKACDDLYLASPHGSEYAEFGDSCGPRGRSIVQTWCEEGRTW